MSLSSREWHKSTCSGDYQDACLEAKARPDRTGVLIRDSKDRSLIPLAFSTATWHDFLSEQQRQR
ncbi:DUF397 domain-containing protein [Streptomyces sp. NPDC056844]|uniref:DUF397 domain-containing protein n=1 Tax=unclassified Streptomyces TaxID=2593676 RepID=UPI0036A7D4CD